LSRERNEQIMRTYLEEVVGNERVELIPEIANEDMVDEVTAGLGGRQAATGWSLTSPPSVMLSRIEKSRSGGLSPTMTKLWPGTPRTAS
jgi:hypothetical protein